MKNIIALDLGQKLGWAHKLECYGGLIRSGTESLKINRFESAGMRFAKLRQFLTKAAFPAMEDLLVVYEEVRGHKGTDAAHAYGGYLATLQTWCIDHEIEYYGVPVATIKKFVTGRGNASKEMMIECIQGQGFDPKDDNEADAIGLLLQVIRDREVQQRAKEVAELIA